MKGVVRGGEGMVKGEGVSEGEGVKGVKFGRSGV